MYIARQPIYDRASRVVGYELLFRDGILDTFPDIDPHDATSRVVLEGGLALGLAELTGGLPAFLNCSRESLVSGIAKVLPAELTVVEILEDIEPDDEVLRACRELRRLGYRIALDDFVYSPRLAPLLSLADIVKLEINSTSPEERRAMLASYSLQFVAEKVETACALQASMDEGFHLFQGYHFGRPELMQRPRQESPRNHLLLGAYLCRAQADAGDLCHLIEDEPSLEHSLRGFSRGIGLAGDGSVVSLFARLGPEGRLHWGHHLLTAGLCDDRAA